MILKFKKLDSKAIIPTIANKWDAGMDLTATSINVVNNSNYGYIEYGTGIAVEIPKGYCGLLFPRSSISDTGLILANSVGLIDSGYRGEIKLRFKYIMDTRHYEIGDRIGQLVIMKLHNIQIEEVNELASSERGEKGFGSSNDIIY